MKKKLLSQIDIYADGADIDFIKDIKFNFSGFTTNPTLMKNSGIKDYKKFAMDFIEISKNKPVSFEVFADEIKEIKSQAKIISSWHPNIYVKIPITNTKGESTSDLVFDLIEDGVKCNVTAIFSLDQIKRYQDLSNKTECILSIFAGRIADTGIDPIPIITEIVEFFKDNKNISYLYCVSKYPTPLYEIKMPDFKTSFFSGYSDHTIGISACLFAVSKGAIILEKHFSNSKAMNTETSPGHTGSMNMDDLIQIREISDNLRLLNSE